MLPRTSAEADPGDMIAMASTLAVGAWSDAVAVVTMSMRGHTLGDVIDSHPAGGVGSVRRPGDETAPVVRGVTNSAVMGVDSSTQSCKVEIRDLGTGRLLGSGSAPHPPAFPPCSEQHPSDWVGALVAAANRAIAACDDTPDIRAISVAAQCHGLVLLDERGDVLRAAKLWNDTTGAPNLARLVERIGARRWVMRIGTLPTAAFTIAKLAWVAEHEPGLLDRVTTSSCHTTT